MVGSIRRRGRDSWQLRVYIGVDVDGRPRWVSITVRGSRRYAEQRLRELVAEVGLGRVRSGTVGDLLERWFVAACPGGRRPPPPRPAPSSTLTWRRSSVISGSTS